MRALIRMMAFSTVSFFYLAGVARPCHVEVPTPAEIRESHLKMYDHDYHHWEQNSVKFDSNSPRLALLFSNVGYFESELTKWEQHPLAFERENPVFWQVLDGARLYHIHHPTATPAQAPAYVDHIFSPPDYRDGPGNGGSPPNRPNELPAGTVPEPSAASLLATAMGSIALWRLIARSRRTGAAAT
jgi:hypothetical protein